VLQVEFLVARAQKCVDQVQSPFGMIFLLFYMSFLSLSSFSFLALFSFGLVLFGLPDKLFKSSRVLLLFLILIFQTFVHLSQKQPIAAYFYANLASNLW